MTDKKYFQEFRVPLVVTGVVLLIAFRVYCAFSYRVDSDEPQHLHVIWGIAHGQIQYKDIFDNHSPLFQILCEPLFRALGDSMDIVEQMRLAMLPFYFGCIGCVYLICARVFSKRCGILAALFTAFYPRFFCTSLEFRPDNLWALNWLLLLATLVCVRRTALRWFLAGLLTGIGFSISMKTSVMALDLAGAGGLTWLLCRNFIGKPSLAATAKTATIFFTGLIVIPGLLLLYFAFSDGISELAYCLIRHNLVAVSERRHLLNLRGIAVLGVLAGMLWWSARVSRSNANPAAIIPRVFLLIAGALYSVILFIFWPLVTREDFLAFMPMVAIAGTPALLAALERFRRGIPRLGWIAATIPSVLIVLELVGDICFTKPWHDRTELQEQFIGNILRLTDPGDYVMDAKGETIFRSRPYYYALEEMTRWKLKRGELEDDIPERMISHNVCVATNNKFRYPRRAVQFIYANFIPVANQLYVAGKILNPALNQPVEFELAIPTNYRLVWQGTSGEALLDGKPYTGDAMRLETGRHTLLVKRSAGPVAVVWANAIERGFSPFYRGSKEEKLEKKQAKRDNIL